VVFAMYGEQEYDEFAMALEDAEEG